MFQYDGKPRNVLKDENVVVSKMEIATQHGNNIRLRVGYREKLGSSTKR